MLRGAAQDYVTSWRASLALQDAEAEDKDGMKQSTAGEQTSSVQFPSRGWILWNASLTQHKATYHPICSPFNCIMLRNSSFLPLWRRRADEDIGRAHLMPEEASKCAMIGRYLLTLQNIHPR